MSSVEGVAGSLRSGSCLGPLPCVSGDTNPDLVPCFRHKALIHTPWIVASREAYAQARVRAFVRFVGNDFPPPSDLWEAPVAASCSDAEPLGAGAGYWTRGPGGRLGAPVLTIVSHPVEDCARWRAAYDAEVFRDPADPNRVVVVHRFASVDAADAFLGSESLRSAMGDAGVAAPPEITVVETAD